MATKQMRIRRKYTYADGNTGSSAKAGVLSLTMECLGTPKEDANGKRVYPVVHEVVVTLADFPAEVIEAATWHGLSQKLGDANASVAKIAKDEQIKDDPERALADLTQSTILEMIEDLKNGFWVTESEGGSGDGSTTMLLEAIVNVLTKAGAEPDAEKLVKIKTAIADTDQAKAFRARPDIAAELAQIKAERAAARAKAAKAKAKEQTPETSLSDLF